LERVLCVRWHNDVGVDVKGHDHQWPKLLVDCGVPLLVFDKSPVNALLVGCLRTLSTCVAGLAHHWPCPARERWESASPKQLSACQLHAITLHHLSWLLTHKFLHCLLLWQADPCKIICSG
jgi:hypothetical protein